MSKIKCTVNPESPINAITKYLNSRQGDVAGCVEESVYSYDDKEHASAWLLHADDAYQIVMVGEISEDAFDFNEREEDNRKRFERILSCPEFAELMAAEDMPECPVQPSFINLKIIDGTDDRAILRMFINTKFN